MPVVSAPLRTVGAGTFHRPKLKPRCGTQTNTKRHATCANKQKIFGGGLAVLVVVALVFGLSAIPAQAADTSGMLYCSYSWAGEKDFMGRPVTLVSGVGFYVGPATVNSCMWHTPTLSTTGSWTRQSGSVQPDGSFSESWKFTADKGSSGGGSTNNEWTVYLKYESAAAPGDVQGMPEEQSGTYTGPGAGSQVGALFDISTARPTRKGYVFLGWDTDGTVETPTYKAGVPATIRINAFTSPVTLIAIWKKDTTPPVINGADDTSITVGTSFDPKAGVTATDDTDGDITPKIQITGTVDNTTPGSYELTYTVSDTAGNKAEAKRTITVTAGPATAMPETGAADGPRLVGVSLTVLTLGVLVAGLGSHKSRCV